MRYIKGAILLGLLLVVGFRIVQVNQQDQGIKPVLFSQDQALTVKGQTLTCDGVSVLEGEPAQAFKDQYQNFLPPSDNRILQVDLTGHFAQEKDYLKLTLILNGQQRTQPVMTATQVTPAGYRLFFAFESSDIQQGENEWILAMPEDTIEDHQHLGFEGTLVYE